MDTDLHNDILKIEALEKEYNAVPYSPTIAKKGIT